MCETEQMSLKEIKLLMLENMQDCLMTNLGELSKAINIAFPFTTKMNELMKMYLGLDEHLKAVLQEIDKIKAEKLENEVDNDNE